MSAAAPTERVYRVLFPFCGIGGGALGFISPGARTRIFGKDVRCESIGGIDNDPAVCKAFVYLTKSPALCADISTLTVARLVDFAGERAPDGVFLSAPCKGSSKLIPDAKALEPKYVKLNALAENWIDLMLAAWGDRPPKFVLFENVPNVTTRAKAMIGRIKSKLRKAGYAIHDGYHDCGELGGLGQRRKRWLMVARHAAQVPPLLYQPPTKRVRGCGEVIGPLPMPGDPAGGKMHKMPRISFLNWVRLALIPAGGDWRDLPNVLVDGQKRREKFKRHEVADWAKPTGTVGGSGSNGVTNVADPRPTTEWFNGCYEVLDWLQPSRAVIGGRSNGALYVADPRVAPEYLLKPSPGRHVHKYAVGAWEAPARTVISKTQPGSGGPAVADPRVPHAFSGDPRLAAKAFPLGYGVTSWNAPSWTITSGGRIAQGSFAVADPRVVVTFSANGAPEGQSVAARWFHHVLRVVPWTEPSGTVTGALGPTNGAACVADPRWQRLLPQRMPYDKAYGVLGWGDPAHTIAAGSDVGQGAYAIADGRLSWLEALDAVGGRVALGCTPHAGAYGVLPWTEAAKTITASACHDNGAFAVVDPRWPDVPLFVVHDVTKAPSEVPVIIAADGTWHRPFTTLELAVLQGLPSEVDGQPLELPGSNATAWREWIGNVVPPPAAAAIATRMLVNLASADEGAFVLAPDGEVWVRPDRNARRTQAALKRTRGETPWTDSTTRTAGSSKASPTRSNASPTPRRSSPSSSTSSPRTSGTTAR